MAICEVNEEVDNSKEVLNDYIPKPFLEHEFEPLGWNDVLAVLATGGVCANIHATRHCDKEGYDIMSIYMVKVIQEDEELGIDSNH